jgi:hypothetical protein
MPLSDEELMEALNKLPEGDDPYINEDDRDMSRFVMDRIDQCFQLPDDFVYEVMVNGNKNTRLFMESRYMLRLHSHHLAYIDCLT